jgi:pimeloyl-ACP methyl ester carboxylesterase
VDKYVKINTLKYIYYIIQYNKFLTIMLILEILKYWLILELINWITYLFMYIKIISPKFLKFKENDTIKIIERIDKLNKHEIEHIIGGCVIYDKITHSNIDYTNFDISKMSKMEIINLIGYSLFGIEINDIHNNSKLVIIIELVKKIEYKLGYEFTLDDLDRYIYRKWGSNFIKFSFRPLILQIPLKIFINSIHLLFTLYLGYKWEQYNKIGFLSKTIDPNKKNLIFIHGLGFGYVPYFQILMELDKKYNLIIIVLPNISSYTYYDRFSFDFDYFPQISQLADTFYYFLKLKNISNTMILSHSFGTYITQILRKDNRSKIFNKIILVDPIIFWIGCFKMSLHVENPFIKKYPLYLFVIDNILSFMIYQCLYLKYVCFRVMFGPDFWIYDIDELANANITIILEKGDYVIPAELLYNKINGNIKCHYFDNDNMLHGSILMEKKYTNQLLEIIEE